MEMWVKGEVIRAQRLLPRTQAEGHYLLLTIRDRVTDERMKLVAPDETQVLNAIREANASVPTKEIKFYLTSSFASLADLTGGRYIGNVYRLTVSNVEVVAESANATPLGGATGETAPSEHDGEGVVSFEVRRRPR